MKNLPASLSIVDPPEREPDNESFWELETLFKQNSRLPKSFGKKTTTTITERKQASPECESGFSEICLSAQFIDTERLFFSTSGSQLEPLQL